MWKTAAIPYMVEQWALDIILSHVHSPILLLNLDAFGFTPYTNAFRVIPAQGRKCSRTFLLYYISPKELRGNTPSSLYV